MLWASVIFEPLLVLQPHRGTFTMQFSYLSFSSLNHMERFGFSNTHGEMTSLYSAAMEEKAEQKKEKKQRNPSENKFTNLPFKVLGTCL